MAADLCWTPAIISISCFLTLSFWATFHCMHIELRCLYKQTHKCILLCHTVLNCFLIVRQLPIKFVCSIFFHLQLLVFNFFLLPVIISSNIWTKLCFHRLSVSDFFLFTFSHWLSVSNVKTFSPSFFPSTSCIKMFSLYFFHRLSVSVQ